MTRDWPSAPAGRSWRHLDEVVDLVARTVAADTRPGGIHQIRWEPGHRTRVAFDSSTGGAKVVEATTGSVRSRGIHEDESLPGLRQILRPEGVVDRLSLLLREPVLGCAATVVSYRPRSRCVLRVDARTSTGTIPVFVKVLAEGIERYAAGHLALSAPVDQGRAAVVPSLLGAWPDLGAVLTLGEPGATVSERLGEASLSADHRLALGESVGAVLARIHATEVPGELRRESRTAADELTALDGHLTAVWHADPSNAPGFTRAVDALRADPPWPVAGVFSHGSFRTGQLVANGDRLTVLDLDGVGLADSARDLGNVMAYLDWAGLRGSDDDPSLVEAVRRGYVAGGGTVDPAALGWWRAAALLKIAGRRYRSLDTERWPIVPALVRTASRLVAAAGSPSAAPVSPVPDIFDPEQATTLLRPVLDVHGSTTAPVVEHAEMLRAAHGRRVVIRYRVAGLEAAPIDVVAKWFAEPHRATVALANMTAFSRWNDAPSSIGTQEPIGARPDLGVVLCRAAGGHPLPDLSAEAAAEVAARVGRWLRRVHEESAALSRRFDLDHEVANLKLWAGEVGRVHDRLTKAARDLEERLELASALVPRIDAAPIHKDFHPGHVVVDSDRVTIIDLDEARMGDPLFDVAHFCAYADSHVSDAFRTGYGAPTGPDPEHRMQYFSAYSHLKIARQRVRNDPAELDDDAIDHALGVLERGAACLDR